MTTRPTSLAKRVPAQLGWFCAPAHIALEMGRGDSFEPSSYQRNTSINLEALPKA